MIRPSGCGTRAMVKRCKSSWRCDPLTPSAPSMNRQLSLIKKRYTLTTDTFLTSNTLMRQLAIFLGKKPSRGTKFGFSKVLAISCGFHTSIAPAALIATAICLPLDITPAIEVELHVAHWYWLWNGCGACGRSLLTSQPYARICCDRVRTNQDRESCDADLLYL
jgi:hypothetical protein